MSFNGKVVLITGASSGIGADAARHLAKLGAKVSIVGRNEKRLNEVADEIKKSGAPTPLVIPGDVTKDPERIVNQTVKHFGKLDVLVNNAGIGVFDNVLTAKMSDFDSVFNTNVRSVYVLTQLCIPHLEKTKGNIVNVSSIAGLKPLPNFTTYCMSKAALDQFTQCAAIDLGPKGIRVNSVNPACIRTPIFETTGMTAQQADEYFASKRNQYPVRRVGEVYDTSTAIAYLADGNLSSFLTGVIIKVDGGAVIAGFY